MGRLSLFRFLQKFNSFVFLESNFIHHISYFTSCYYKYILFFFVAAPESRRFLSQYFFLNIFSIFCMLLRHKVFFSFDHVSFQGGIWWICGDWSAKWIVCFGKIDWIHWLVSFCGKLKRLWRIKIYRERSGPTKKGGGEWIDRLVSGLFGSFAHSKYAPYYFSPPRRVRLIKKEYVS